MKHGRLRAAGQGCDIDLAVSAHLNVRGHRLEVVGDSHRARGQTQGFSLFGYDRERFRRPPQSQW